MSTRHIAPRPASAGCTAYPFDRHGEGANAAHRCMCKFCRHERLDIALAVDLAANPEPAAPAPVQLALL